MSTYTVTAVRWSRGWELHIDGEGVTQVRTLDQAVEQVRDYLATVHQSDFTDATIKVTADLGGLEFQVAEARMETQRAAELQRAAADHSRAVAHALRHDKGLSVTDTAAVLGVSRGRVSQLVG